ncbi:DUF58 domain-containing protein [Altericista sp. CCNU0014]|uniref:DUF58 domain-containing protein n=1 Tax=Altericista sp. CCNU0014 TaxID=3082949 RepID=UPI00384C1E37
MKRVQRLLAWLEARGAAPAYAGWVLVGLTVCFWIAATNTMAGWLYVLSGVGGALLLLSAVLPARALKGIKIARSPVSPVHVGEALFVAVDLQNPTAQTKGLLTVCDRVPSSLGNAPEVAVEAIAPHDTYRWDYLLEPERRGRYCWTTLILRTGAPFGLFWSRQARAVPTEVLVYPRVLPLARCPILDEVGPSVQQLQQVPRSQTGNDGSTRSLRPYRKGDPMRMVHWRSSARFDALRVREMEVLSGGNTYIIALDTYGNWHSDCFEQAVVAAASLFRYATQHHGAAQLWTPQWGLVRGMHPALEVLAQIEPQPTGEKLPEQPVIWLTANPEGIKTLPSGSRYIFWPQSASTGESGPTYSTAPLDRAGITISPATPLQVQLQKALYQG